MPKITYSDIIGPTALGFVKEMFGSNLTDQQFQDLVTAVIAEQALELEGRIGTTAYNNAATPNATYVKLAEKWLTAAELLQRRINKLLVNVSKAGNEFDTSNERKQRQDYLDKVFGNQNADPPITGMIDKILGGSTTDSQDFASGSLVTSHF